MLRAALATCSFLALLACRTPPPLAAPPPASSNLVLEAPVERADEAVPLGNGLLGALLWGGGGVVRLSLDRSDLWDLRAPPADGASYEELRALQAAGDEAGIAARFEQPYAEAPFPTKIPAARLELELPEGVAPVSFSLDLAHAAGSVAFADGRLDAFCAATAPVALLRWRGFAPAVRLVRPPALDALGYGRPREGRAADAVWFAQDAPDGRGWAVVAAWRTRGEDRELAVAVATADDAADPLAEARARAGDALAAGYADLYLPHRAWWRAFWGQGRVELPEARLQALYDFGKYLYGAGARNGGPALALRGPWTAEDAKLPPWRGGYHHALSAPMTYLAAWPAGLAEARNSLLAWHWRLLPRYRERARAFYGVPGAVVPGSMAGDGQPLGGPAPHALSPIHGVWVAHAFWLEWRYGDDETFLRERAYPFCTEIAVALAALLEQDGAGRLRLPLSASPWFGEEARRWLPPNSSYEQALLRWLFAALAEMASVLEDESAQQLWTARLQALGDFARDGRGGLAIADGVPYAASHRHLAHAVAVHPLRLLAADDADAQAIAEATVETLQACGTQGWAGYSFAWFACMLAATGRAEPALEHLEAFARAFVARNGLHLNGAQGEEELTLFRYRAFTLEGNFLFLQAIHEMLLQTRGGALVLFPAVSARWPDVSFEMLRAEGGYVVSATRAGGETRSLRIVATRPGVLRLHPPFGDGRVVLWNTGVQKRDGVLEASLGKGDVLTGTVLF